MWRHRGSLTQQMLEASIRAKLLNLLAGPSYRTPACPSCNTGGWINLKIGEWKLIPIQLDPASIPVERVVLASCTSLQKSAGASVFRRSSPSNSPEVSIFAAAAALSQRPFKWITFWESNMAGREFHFKHGGQLMGTSSINGRFLLRCLMNFDYIIPNGPP